MATTNLGRVQPINRGLYDPAFAYTPLDLFTHNEVMYLVDVAATGITPPNSSYYTQVSPELGNTYLPREDDNLYQDVEQQSTIDLNFERGKYLVDNGELVETTNANEVLTVDRASTKMVEGPDGKLRQIPVDTAARQWRQGVPQGVLIEEQRTNLLTWSEDFTNAVWAIGRNGILTTSDPSIINGVDWSRLEVADGEDLAYAVQSCVPPSIGEYTLSGYFRKETLSGVDGYIFITGNFVSFDLAEGSVSSQVGSPSNIKVEDVGHRAWRLSFTVTLSDTSAKDIQIGARNASPGQLVDFTGAQLEEGTTPSSYIPTTTAQVTRAADNVTRTLGSELKSEGTIIAQYYHTSSTDRYVYDLGVPTDRVAVLSYGTNIQTRLLVDGIAQFRKTIAVTDGLVKTAYSFSNTYQAIAANGTVISENNTIQIADLDTLHIGKFSGAELGFLNSGIVSLTYLPYTLTPEQLQTLTQPEA